MAYATVEQLARMGIGGALLASYTPSQQQEELDAASATADDYLRVRYSVPLAKWTDSLSKRVCQIAAYFLHSDRGYPPDTKENDQIRKQYDDAIQWLEWVRDSEIDPGFEDPSDGSDGEGDAALLAGHGFAMTTSPRRGW